MTDPVNAAHAFGRQANPGSPDRQSAAAEGFLAGVAFGRKQADELLAMMQMEYVAGPAPGDEDTDKQKIGCLQSARHRLRADHPTAGRPEPPR